VAPGVQSRLHMPPKTADKQKLRYLPNRTKLDHLADMLSPLCETHPNRRLRLMADSACGVGEMITRCLRIAT